MDLTDLFATCKAVTAEQSNADLLEDKSAVYAFYDLLYFKDSEMIDAIDAFVTKHGRVLELRTSTETESYLPEHVRIHLRGNPLRFKGKGRQAVEGLPAVDLPLLSRMLMFLSFYNEPLYIGETKHLKTRFIQHHDSGFLYAMKKDFKRPPGEFFLFAFYCEPAFIKAIESILIQVANPPFCDQKS